MFENILGQAVTGQLVRDIETGVLAPAMLFSGPPASGKGSAALELGRIISCEAAAPGRALWNCSCPACARHRLLIHPDILCLGWRPFSAEIAASAGAFLRDTGSVPGRMLFVRSVRKLLARFNPLLWEDDPKAGKIAPLANTLEEELDELELAARESAGNPSSQAKDSLARLGEGIEKAAFKLESEGISENIPIAQIRRAAFWCRLAPAGRGKLLLIENADRMQEEGRNSLLKLLEEPPERVHLILTSPRPGSLLPTILSRVRPYRFSGRSAETEAELIRRVFRDQLPAASQDGGNRIGEYLDSFLPVSGETLEALAAFFAASSAYKAALLAKKRGRPLSGEVIALGKFSAPRAEDAGFGRPEAAGSAAVSLIMEKTNKFEIRSLFPRFLSFLLEQVSQSGKKEAAPPPSLLFNELWRNSCAWAQSAVTVYKLSSVVTLEKLFTDLSRGMAEL